MCYKEKINNNQVTNNTWPKTITVVHSLSCIWLFATPWTAARQASLSSTISQSLLKLMSIGSMMPSNHLILGHPLLLPSIFSSIRIFSNELALCIRWPKFWSFSFNISPSNEHSVLISFRIDRFDLLVLQIYLCCYSVAQLCLTLCDSMACDMSGFPVLHYLPEFSQTHVHWVSDAIQPSHPGPKVTMTYQIASVCSFVWLL